mmetsp:Transcript_3683/g.4086  ORF Transcript_3683/g.4086 Transcript_3683/m.4086 type:complete len:108 (+) Transcript_3683:682-1005(+)|eukprot:CAMPEP_0168515572 /NCGR_PEP_ID=MMETSP0405-20121227/4846_1 /TAXON_ID=498012 /ORGANISM="Trichosphaerium sp, Strain Am-I-7 wt" /LENGTH=107 /DNA_ID=CAMNT_0008535037 /DNA_START=696 /DNA_END=1019 /DNA_ORIENTATION=-
MNRAGLHAKGSAILEGFASSLHELAEQTNVSMLQLLRQADDKIKKLETDLQKSKTTNTSLKRKLDTSKKSEAKWKKRAKTLRDDKEAVKEAKEVVEDYWASDEEWSE